MDKVKRSVSAIKTYVTKSMWGDVELWDMNTGLTLKKEIKKKHRSNKREMMYMS